MHKYDDYVKYNCTDKVESNEIWIKYKLQLNYVLNNFNMSQIQITTHVYIES
jgi:hypothetical protein